MMSGDPHRLFVYGSLLSTLDLPAHRMLHPGASFVATGWVSGRLYDTGEYPALVFAGSGSDRVLGELYALDPTRAESLLARLDRFEGYLPDDPQGSLFRRVRTEVTLEGGGEALAWVYRYARSMEGFSAISSGDYAAYWRGR